MTAPAFDWMNISPSCPFRGSIKVKGLSVCIFRRVGVRTPNEFRTPQQSCAHFTVAHDWCPRGRRGAQQKPSPAAARGAGGAAVHGAPLEPRSCPVEPRLYGSSARPVAVACTTLGQSNFESIQRTPLRRKMSKIWGRDAPWPRPTEQADS